MYDVGKVLFVVLKKKQKIVPVQVVEQIVRRSMDGETIQYQVKVPGYDDPVPIESIGTDIYVNVDDVKGALKQNAGEAIDRMADAAMSLATTHFRKGNVTNHMEEAGGGGAERIMVDLGDGKKAKVDISNLKKLHL